MPLYIYCAMLALMLGGALLLAFKKQQVPSMQPVRVRSRYPYRRLY